MVLARALPDRSYDIYFRWNDLGAGRRLNGAIEDVQWWFYN